MSLEKYKQVIDEDFAKDADFIDKVIKELDLEKKAKILDIGTGFGAMSILLALNGFHVLTGQPQEDSEWEQNKEHHLEHNEEYESHHHSFTEFDWKENARTVGVEDKIEFQYLDAENLDFPDESFDGLFMYDTLQHIKNRGVALNECLRVTKASGLVCVIEWNKKCIKETEEKYGFTIDYVDPRDILSRDDASIELISGNLVNMYLLRKI